MPLSPWGRPIFQTLFVSSGGASKNRHRLFCSVIGIPLTVFLFSFSALIAPSYTPSLIPHPLLMTIPHHPYTFPDTRTISFIVYPTPHTTPLHAVRKGHHHHTHSPPQRPNEQMDLIGQVSYFFLLHVYHFFTHPSTLCLSFFYYSHTPPRLEYQMTIDTPPPDKS